MKDSYPQILSIPLKQICGPDINKFPGIGDMNISKTVRYHGICARASWVVMASNSETEILQAPKSDSSSSFDKYTGSGSMQEKALVRKQDWRIIPLCALVYLLCFLDRSDIGIEPTLVMDNHYPRSFSAGNAKILNSESGDDLLQKTGTSSYQFR